MCYYVNGHQSNMIPSGGQKCPPTPFVMDELIKELCQMDIELMYKGKALVDINKVLEIVNAKKPKNSTDVLKQSMEEMQACLQKVRRESL